MKTGETMESKTENVLKQEWLANVTEPSNVISVFSGNILGLLLLNLLFPKQFSPIMILLIYILSMILGFWFIGYVWTYNAKFISEKELFSLRINRTYLKAKDIRFDKSIYAAKKNENYTYYLTLEVWFGRKPIVFCEKISSIEGRTEEIFYDEGIEAKYWSNKTGKIDELAKFIDAYNEQTKAD